MNNYPSDRVRKFNFEIGKRYLTIKGEYLKLREVHHNTAAKEGRGRIVYEFAGCLIPSKLIPYFFKIENCRVADGIDNI